MTTFTDESSVGIDIACSLTTTEQRERGDEWAELLVDADALTELSAGYALRFPNRDAWITRAVELIIAERKCCPFFSFTLAFEGDGGSVWLHIAGPGEVKTFIREQMVPVHLRPSR